MRGGWSDRDQAATVIFTTIRTQMCDSFNYVASFPHATSYVYDDTYSLCSSKSGERPEVLDFYRQTLRERYRPNYTTMHQYRLCCLLRIFGAMALERKGIALYMHPTVI